MKRIEKIRLYPNQAQMAALDFTLDVTRQLYNAVLQERRDAWHDRQVSITPKIQYAELTELRHEDPRIAAVYRECEDAVLHRNHLAFQAFFRRVKSGETPGFPRFQSWHRWASIQYPHGDRALKFDDRQQSVYVPGAGKVKLRKDRAVPEFGRAWLAKKNDRWYACFECERVMTPLPATGVTLGIDRGVHVLAGTSEGQLIRNAAVGEKRKVATKRLHRALDALSVYVGSGKNRRCINRNDPQRVAAVKRLARSKEREANARRDYAHQVARRIVNGADRIALEDLRLKNMTRSARGTLENPGKNVAAKAALNRVVLDAGFGLLAKMIADKAEEAGRTIEWVDPRYSSLECSQCGHRAKESRRRRRFECVACGHKNHADVNAALVIRGRAELCLDAYFARKVRYQDLRL